MKKDKRLDAVRLRSRHIVGPIIGNIIVVLTVAALLVTAILAIFGYICYFKTDVAVDNFENVIRVYETDGPSILSGWGIDSYIEDADGNVIFSSGTDTSDHGNPVTLMLIDEFVKHSDGKQYTAYPDSEGTLIRLMPSGYILFDFSEIIGIDDPDSISNDRGELLMPFWLSRKLDDGSVFYMKSNLGITMTDIVLLTAVTGISGFIILFASIIIHAGFISKIIRENKLVKLLFEDPVSHNHNWLWFLSKGKKLLKKRSNADVKFAVVSLTFVRYRNFVLCHSLEEGEIMLGKVYDQIATHLSRNEIVSHSTSSNFPMLMEYSEREALQKRLEDIICELEGIDQDHKFSFQAGVSFISDHFARNKDSDLDEEYNNASAARMTLSQKNDESGIAFFDSELVEHQKWIDKVNELQQKAVDNEEFQVYYQPKYDPRTDELRGAEALIRWQSPELGFVPPGQFIDIFENNGFITEIDHYMLEHVSRDQKKWLDEGLDLVPISVNVSRAHFVEIDLAEQIRDIVAGAGCPFKYIEIELTESAFFDDKKALTRTISKLQEYGFTVSMDDFGSGYSSLNSLKDLPLNVLKLDAGFFRDSSEDDRAKIVVSEAIKLAKHLHMKTVAEGVELKDQVDFLADEGCDMIQGYYYAKPMPGQDFEERMRSSSDSGEAADTETDKE